MNRWAHLYLVACAVLGDETRAGDLMLRARTEAELEAALRREGAWPQVPLPTPEVVEHVALLRRRSRQRRWVSYGWGIAAGLFLLLMAVAVQPIRIDRPAEPVSSHPAASPVASPVHSALERRIPVKRAVNQNGYGLRVHEVVIGPGYTVVQWQPQTPGQLAVPPSATPYLAEVHAGSQILSRQSEPHEQTARFDGVPADANELVLRSNPLVWWEEVTLPLSVGAHHTQTGAVLERISREGDTVTLWLTAGSGAVFLDTRLADSEGRTHRPSRLSMSMEDSEGRWTMEVEVSLPPGAELASLHFRAMHEQPPLEIRIPL